MLNAFSAVLLFLVGYFFFRSLISDKETYREKMENARREAEKRAEDRRAAKAARAVGAEKMYQCSVCDAYIPASGTTNCGRSDCPY